MLLVQLVILVAIASIPAPPASHALRALIKPLGVRANVIVAPPVNIKMRQERLRARIVHQMPPVVTLSDFSAAPGLTVLEHAVSRVQVR